MPRLEHIDATGRSLRARRVLPGILARVRPADVSGLRRMIENTLNRQPACRKEAPDVAAIPA